MLKLIMEFVGISVIIIPRPIFKEAILEQYNALMSDTEDREENIGTVVSESGCLKLNALSAKKRRGRFLSCFYFAEGIFFRMSLSLLRASFSVSSRFAKWKRMYLFSGSLKKLEPGTAPTPTYSASFSQNSRSLS